MRSEPGCHLSWPKAGPFGNCHYYKSEIEPPLALWTRRLVCGDGQAASGFAPVALGQLCGGTGLPAPSSCDKLPPFQDRSDRPSRALQRPETDSHTHRKSRSPSHARLCRGRVSSSGRSTNWHHDQTPVRGWVPCIQGVPLRILRVPRAILTALSLAPCAAESLAVLS